MTRLALVLAALLTLAAPAGAQTPLAEARRRPGAAAEEAPAPRRPIFGALLSADLRVRAVLPASPAARLGLARGDRLRALDGLAIADRAALKRALRQRQRGDDLALTITRSGHEKHLNGRLGARFPYLATDERRRGRFVLAVVPVAFADRAPRFQRADFEKLLFSRRSYKKRSPTGEAVFGSVADYFDEASAGRFRLTGAVHDWVRIPETFAAIDRLPPLPLLGQRALLGQALSRVNKRAGRDVFAQVDGIAFITAGGRGTHGRVLWPHSAVLMHRGRLLPYYVMEETESGRFAGIGVHCHEFGHVLGLPDKYGLAGDSGLGCFCLMAVGHRGYAARKVPLDAPTLTPRAALEQWLRDKSEAAREQLEDLVPGPKRRPRPAIDPADDPPGLIRINRRPLHLCAACKERLGWIDPVVLDTTQSQRLVLEPVEGRADAVAKLLLDPAGQEYYLLEYRSKTGFDKGLPSSGLLIWHAGDLAAPLKNFVPAPLLDLEEAHGRRSLDNAYRAPELVPFGGEGRQAFTPRTTPSSKSLRPGAPQLWITGIRERGGRLELTVGARDPSS